MRIDLTSGILYEEKKAVSPKAVVLLVHGLGSHSGRLEFLSEFFLHNEISSYAIELRGHGQAPATKDHPASFNTYLNDIKYLYEIIKSENPSKKIFIIGESMGAIISFLAALKDDNFSGLVCIAPVLKSLLHFTLLDYLGIFLPVVYDPEKEITMPFDYTMCTRDTEYLKKIGEEKPSQPRASSKLLFDIAVGQFKCGVLKNKLKIPLLFLLAGKDMIASSAESKIFFSSIKLKDKKLIEYPDMYHSLSIDSGREEVFADILTWMMEKV